MEVEEGQLSSLEPDSRLEMERPRRESKNAPLTLRMPPAVTLRRERN
jgi:hypothetical protein